MASNTQKTHKKGKQFYSGVQCLLYKFLHEVDHFQVEQSNNCFFDKVEVYQNFSVPPVYTRLCGNDLPTPIISNSNILYLRFVSNSLYTYGGFKIHFYTGPWKSGEIPGNLFFYTVRIFLAKSIFEGPSLFGAISLIRSNSLSV